MLALALLLAPDPRTGGFLAIDKSSLALSFFHLESNSARKLAFGPLLEETAVCGTWLPIDSPSAAAPSDSSSYSMKIAEEEKYLPGPCWAHFTFSAGSDSSESYSLSLHVVVTLKDIANFFSFPFLFINLIKPHVFLAAWCCLSAWVSGFWAWQLAFSALVLKFAFYSPSTLIVFRD